MDELLEQLQHDELISEDQARVFRIESLRTEKPVFRILNEADIFPVGVLERYQIGASFLELTVENFVPDPSALALLAEETARRYNTLPVSFDEARCQLVLAMDDVSNLVVKDRLRREIPSHVVLDFRCSDAADIKRILDKCYGACYSLNGILQELELQSISAHAHNSVDPLPVVRLIDAILQNAVTRRASDIHMSPEGLFVSVRYRVDGVLGIACCLHVSYWSAMLVRVKVLSEMDIAETRLPQDGHVTRTIDSQRIDFRVSSFPVRGGENLVLRVLDRRRGIRSLAALCGNDDTRNNLLSMVQRPHGLVLVCGPTGSGKTTTLYALLQSLDASTLNIMTLEDPVEYPMPGIRQTRVQGITAFGFADGVRGVLRQDPDVILIGEIRDADSCLMACRAAMTGHLVLTSTHADDCIGAINRLVELGAQRSTLAGVLAGVLSQRLIRKACVHCDGNATCAVCGDTGYSGRIALFECLKMSEAMAAMLQSDSTVVSIRRQAALDGMQSLMDAACEQVRAGLTTGEEIERVLGTRVPAI